MNWQPFDSAPTGGPNILLYGQFVQPQYGGPEARVARWWQDAWHVTDMQTGDIFKPDPEDVWGWMQIVPPSRYVYLLSDYSEYGSAHVTATLDRSALVRMLSANFPEANFPEADDDKWLDEHTTALKKLLEKTDEELAVSTEDGVSKYGVSGHDLLTGWGGIQLHVVRLV